MIAGKFVNEMKKKEKRREQGRGKQRCKDLAQIADDDAMS